MHFETFIFQVIPLYLIINMYLDLRKVEKQNKYKRKQLIHLYIIV